jgi:probable HAF family extracellular repeat protein
MMLTTLGQASLWGSVVALVVFVICRIFPRLSPTVRFWLWWFVFAKLFSGLLPSVSLAVLPAVTVTQQAAAIMPTIKAQSAIATNANANANITNTNNATSLPTVPLEREPALTISALAVQTLLVRLWIVGALLLLLREITPIVRLRRQLAPRKNTPVQIGPPGVGPLLFGLLRPTIVLPPGLTPKETRLAIAHETAHLTRRDQWLALLPMLGRVVFWFLPTVYLASRQLAMAREEACDALAQKATDVSAREYGAFLLRLTEPTTGALGMASPAFDALQMRLLALKHPVRAPSRATLLTLALCSALTLPGWRLTEKVAHAARQAGDKPIWSLTDLGTFGGRYGDAFAINDASQIVGTANGSDGRGRAFLWESGRLTDLGEERRRSIAFAISEGGDVALAAFRSGSMPKAALLHQETKKLLPGLPNFKFAVAKSVSPDGEHIVGSARSGTTQSEALASRAVLWERGQVRDLGTLGGRFSHATAINARGQIVGKADLSRVATHAFLYEANTMRDLGTLGGLNSQATAINSAGVVVGTSETLLPGRKAFVWTRENGLQALSGEDAEATDINDAGEIVGSVGGHAVLWHPDGTREDLSAPGWDITIARSINNKHQIVGQGQTGGDAHAVLVQRTPAH